MKRILIVVVAALVCSAAPVASAQSRGPAPVKRAAEKTATPKVEPVVDVHATFSLSTGSERWSLDDPMPASGTEFSGRKLSLEERMVNASKTTEGDTQYLFPVSWFEPYTSQNPDIKYVVVRYKGGRAISVMAEYQSNRVSLPKEQFEAHPDGKTFYSNVSVVRQNGQVYLKQVVSKGADDGKGGLWVDLVVLYSQEDTKNSTAAVRRP